MEGDSHRHIGGSRTGTVIKLNRSKTAWIIRQKRKGQMTNREIAEVMGISVIWVKKLWARYRGTRPACIAHPCRTGRKVKSLPGRRDHSAVLQAYASKPGASSFIYDILSHDGINISQRNIHSILLAAGSSERQPRKSRRRKWVRYERTYSNSMWHTDYKLLDDGRWFIAYQDDASRLIVGYGVFDHATAENAIFVLKNAISRHGKPASILTDHGSQFYANEKESCVRGSAAFEKKLVELGISHRLARVNHPQTNGKLERFHGELQRKLPIFVAASHGIATKVSSGGGDAHLGGPFSTATPRDPVERFVDWYNNGRPHMSLDMSNLETPARAYARKMPPPDTVVSDAKSGERYRTSRSPAGGVDLSLDGGGGSSGDGVQKT